MKKILLMVLLLMSVMCTTFAADVTDNSADSKIVIDSLKEIRYNVEAGVNIGNYINLVSKANVEYRKYIDKYPVASSDIYPAISFALMLDPYLDAETIWRKGVYEQNKYPTDSNLVLLFKAYPSLQEKVTPHYLTDKKGNNIISTKWYPYDNVMQALWSIASEREKSLGIK